MVYWQGSISIAFVLITTHHYDRKMILVKDKIMTKIEFGKSALNKCTMNDLTAVIIQHFCLLNLPPWWVLTMSSFNAEVGCCEGTTFWGLVGPKVS